MGTIYENIIKLCNERGIKGGKMCSDIGISKGLLTDLKSGRKKGMSAATADKIASYFGVSVGYILGTEKEKAPVNTTDESLSDDDLMAAFFRGGDPDLTQEEMEAMWQDAKNFRDFIIQKKKMERGK